jgi:transcriptional regulator of acetoin/glycerol metabolism
MLLDSAPGCALEPDSCPPVRWRALPANSRDPATRRRLLDHAREEFLRGGEPAGVSPEIARSWLRARDLHRIDPGLRRAPLVSDEELELRRERDETLAVAAPVLAGFSAILAESGEALAYFDADGCMLSIGGDLRTVRRAAEIHFCPGARWTEDAAGTNGPGTSLAERRPVEVFGSEHYVLAWRAWASASAPILAPGRAEPVGVVDITGPSEAHDRQALLAAAAIASAVEQRLRAILGVRDEVVRHAMRSARASGDALLAVDARGRVLAANDAARRRLSLDGELPPEVRERIAAALRAAGADAPEEELSMDWPWGADDRRRVVCSPMRYGERPIGSLVRVLPAPAPRTIRASARPRSGATTRYGFQDIVGRSERLRAALDLAQVAARNDLPVVLHGESGTGKELFAHGIRHREQRRHPGAARRGGAVRLRARRLHRRAAGGASGQDRGGERRDAVPR